MEGQGRAGHGGSLRFNTLAVRRGGLNWEAG